ncbi:hypothetical protein GQ53DRAFT_643452 [Thozetella sp. PMI_491]|nr:hypothetical protein GQ53DRAFT_643452 [Thozetella sp. PMI_491]
MRTNSAHLRANPPFCLRTLETYATYSVATLQRLLGPLAWLWARTVRLYRRLIDRSAILLRTIGLGILTFVRGDKDEPAKVAIDSSRKLALTRCAIHVVPALVSIALITINLTGYFIGNELQGSRDQDNIKLGMLQIAAKIQELLIVSSAGTVIFHTLHAEMTRGEGVPFGLLVSGWSFAQASYFWSAEFWGGVIVGSTTTRSRWRLYRFVVLILIGGVLALTAGPATAVLMMPRKQDWPVGGGIFWLNGSDEQLWPRHLDADYYAELNCSSGEARFSDSRCPSAGFLPLLQHYTTWWNDQSTAFGFELLDKNLRKTMYSAPSLVPEANTWSYTAHAPSATLQDAIRSLHNGALNFLAAKHPLWPPTPLHLKWADMIRFELSTKVPAVRVLCLAQGVIDLTLGNLTLEFPNIEGFDAYWDWQKQGIGLPVTSLKNDTLDVQEDVRRHLLARGITNNKTYPLGEGIFNESRTTLQVPIDLWGQTGASLGAVMLFKDIWTRSEPPSNVLACSVDARWAQAKINIDLTENTQLNYEYITGTVRNLVTTKLDIEESHGHLGYSHIKPLDDGSMPMIRLSPSWYDIVAPVLPVELNFAANITPLAGARQTTAEKLTSTIFHTNSVKPEFENIIATVIADGLSRCGLIPNYNASRFLEAWPYRDWTIEREDLARTLVRYGEPKESFPAPKILQSGNMTRMVTRARFTGYVLSSTGWFDYLCIVVLLTHSVLALAHTLFVVWRGETSGAWDTILELITLAKTSRPPSSPILANTCAGIKSFKTVGLIAWVERSPAQSSALCHGQEPNEELELRLKDGRPCRSASLKPVPGVLYGRSI